MPGMFDRIVVVDWSANSSPKRGVDSIWIAVLDVAEGAVASVNPPTRAAATEMLDTLLTESAGAGAARTRATRTAAARTGTVRTRRAGAGGGAHRTLIGMDASLGYPSGTATALGCHDVPWQATWDLLRASIADDDHNRNNRFEVAAELNRRIGAATGPFWGCPRAKAGAHLAPTKPMSFGALGEWRHTEAVLREYGHRPFSSWQLLGAGAVGSQSLLAIAALAGLRHLHPALDVWPFTTGLRPPVVAPGAAVLAEVWPSMFPTGTGDVRDRMQVEATAVRLAAADAEGELVRWFAPAVPEAHRGVVEREEGWVLGAGVAVAH